MGPPHPSSVCQSNNHLEAHSGTTFLDETSPVRNGFGVWPLVVELSHPWAVEISWCSPWVAFWLLVPCYGWIPYDHAHGLQFHDDSTFGIDGCSPQPHPPNSRPDFCWGNHDPCFPVRDMELSRQVPFPIWIQDETVLVQPVKVSPWENPQKPRWCWKCGSCSLLEISFKLGILAKWRNAMGNQTFCVAFFFSTPLTPVCAFGRSNQRIKNAGC